MPSHWITSPGVWSYGAAALAFGFVALRLMLRWQPGGKPALLLAVAVTTVAAAAGACAFAVGATAASWSVARALELLRSAATLGFLLAFLGVRDSGKGATRGGAWWVAMVCVGALLVVLQIPLGISPPGVPADGDFFQSLGFVAALASAIFGLVLVEQCFRRTPGTSRWQVRPLLLAFAAQLGYDLFLYSDALLFRVLDVDLWGARGIAQALSVPLLVLTLDRTRNWSFELAVSRSVLTGSTALAATGAYLLIMAGAGFLLRLVGGSWGRALETALIFAALLLLVFVGLSGTFRAKVRVFVAKHFFTYRYDYREEWLRFTSTLNTMSASNPEAACITALGDLVESPGGAVWLMDAAGRYRQRAHLQFPSVDGVLEASEPLPAFLRRTGWVLEVNDVLSRSASYENVELPAAIAGLPAAWLIVPLNTSDDLVGFVVLTHPRVHIDIDWEVRDLLKTAGRQAASFLAYAIATEALLEARKFDAFHRLSTFVVHDLKNLVAQLQLMLSNAERHRENPDFQRDMLSTIEHVVGRMHQLMRQLRPDATGGDRPKPIDVAAVAAKTLALRAEPRTGLKVEVDEGILAWAHEDRLERVLAHLVQNAFDASGNSPQVLLRASREGAEVLIEVSDRGSGMTAEFVRERLFRPFQTTKESGMGIGIFECQQYVQQIGGRIDVESAPDIGTSVKVRLRAVADPLKQESAAA